MTKNPRDARKILIFEKINFSKIFVARDNSTCIDCKVDEKISCEIFSQNFVALARQNRGIFTAATAYGRRWKLNKCALARAKPPTPLLFIK